MNNSMIRFRAREALKKNGQVAILIGFLAVLPNLLSQLFSMLYNSAINEKFYQYMLAAAYNPSSVSTQDLIDMISEIPVSHIEINVIVAALAFLVTPMLTLGLKHYLIDLLRNDPHPINCIFSRIRIWMKAVGLTLVILLKIILWAIPGFIVMFGCTYAVVATVSSYEELLNGLLMVIPLCYGLIIVLVIMALLRYQLAGYIMADRPETRILAAIRQSKAIVKGRKGTLFGMDVYFVMLTFIVSAIQALISYVSPVLASTVYMVFSLIVSLYMYASVSGFYLAYTENASNQQAEIPDNPDTLN